DEVNHRTSDALQTPTNYCNKRTAAEQPPPLYPPCRPRSCWRRRPSSACCALCRPSGPPRDQAPSRLFVREPLPPLQRERNDAIDLLLERQVRSVQLYRISRLAQRELMRYARESCVVRGI